MYSTASVNIRKGPGTNFAILRTAKPSTILLVGDSAVNDFVIVLDSDNTKVGWVARRFLQMKPLSDNQLQDLAEEASTKEALTPSTTLANGATLNNHSLGFKLAVLESDSYTLGKYPSESDQIVKRYNSLLTQLNDKYVEDSEQIADITVRARKILRDNGVEEKMVVLMEGMNLVFNLDQDSLNLRYLEVATIYVAGRKKGLDSKKSIEGISEFLRLAGIY